MDNSFNHKIESIVDTARLQGGGSWDSNLDPVSQTDGYMVAVFGMESIIPDEDFNAAAVKSFYDTHESHISDQNFLGVWYDPSMGHYVLDVSMHIDDLRTAVLEGKHHQQTAIFDLTKGEEIYLSHFDDYGNVIDMDQNLSLPSKEGASWTKHFQNSEWKISKGRKKSKLYYPNGDPSIDYGYRDKQQYETMLYVQRSGPSEQLYSNPKKSGWYFSYDPDKAQIAREKLIKQLSQQKWWNQSYDPRPPSDGDILRLHTDLTMGSGRDVEDIAQIAIDMLGLEEHITPRHVSIKVESGSTWKRIGPFEYKPLSDLYLKINGIPESIAEQSTMQRAASTLSVKIPLELLKNKSLRANEISINKRSDIIKRSTPYDGDSQNMTNLDVLATLLSVLPPDIAPLYKWIAKGIKDQELNLDNLNHVNFLEKAAPYIEWQRRFGNKDFTEGSFDPDSGSRLELQKWIKDLEDLGLDLESNEIPWDDEPIWTDKKGNKIYALDSEDDADMIRHGKVLNHCYASRDSEFHEGYTSMMNEGTANMYAIRDKSGRPLASSLIGLRGVSPENPYGTEWVPLESRSGGSSGQHELHPSGPTYKENPIARILDGFLASAEKSGIEIDRSEENTSGTPYRHPEFGVAEPELDPSEWEYEANYEDQEILEGTSIEDIIDVAHIITNKPYIFEDGDPEPDYDDHVNYYTPGARISISDGDLIAAVDDYIDDVINYAQRSSNDEIIDAVVSLVLIAMYLGDYTNDNNVEDNYSFAITMDALIEAAFEGAKSLEKEQTATQQLIMPEEPENAQAVDLSTPPAMGDWVALVSNPNAIGQITNWFWRDYESKEKKFEISFYNPNTNRFEETGGRFTAEQFQKTQPPYLFNPWRYSDPEATETLDNPTLHSFIELLKFFKDNAPTGQFRPPNNNRGGNNTQEIVKLMTGQAQQQLSGMETNPSSSTPLGQTPGQRDTDSERYMQGGPAHWFTHVKESVPQDSDTWFDPGLASRYRVPTTSEPQEDDEQMWKDWEEFIDNQDKVSNMKKKSDKFNSGDRVMFTDKDSNNAELGQGGTIVDKKTTGWKSPSTGDLVELYTIEWDNGNIGQAASFQLEQSWGQVPPNSPWDKGGGEEEEGWSMVRNAKGD